jgi:hypothetical protein
LHGGQGQSSDATQKKAVLMPQPVVQPSVSGIGQRRCHSQRSKAQQKTRQRACPPRSHSPGCSDSCALPGAHRTHGVVLFYHAAPAGAEPQRLGSPHIGQPATFRQMRQSARNGLYRSDYTVYPPEMQAADFPPPPCFAQRPISGAHGVRAAIDIASLDKWFGMDIMFVCVHSQGCEHRSQRITRAV